MIRLGLRKNYWHRQWGSTLILILMFLSLLSMLGLTAMQGSTLQEKMAGNFRDRELAMQAAEDALRIAEDYARSLDVESFGNNTAGLYKADPGGPLPNPFLSDWLKDTETLSITDDAIGIEFENVSEQPRFYIQYLGPSPIQTFGMGRDDQFAGVEADMFRAVVRGVGLSSNSVVVLESYFSGE